MKNTGIILFTATLIASATQTVHAGNTDIISPDGRTVFSPYNAPKENPYIPCRWEDNNS